MASPIGF